MARKVFIDGEAGTTGLQIRERLAARDDLTLVSLPTGLRKDREARRERLNGADAVILCLPDGAARDAVTLIENPDIRVIDASTAHRVAAGWVYGFPEMTSTQREAITSSKRVSNPGCFPTGFIALVRPLVERGLIPASFPLTVNGFSGYSGGGRSMIEAFENPAAPDRTVDAFRLYALPLAHKHVPEMRLHGLLSGRPLFAPAVGRWRQGMIVEVALHLRALPGHPGLSDIHEALSAAYGGEAFVEVVARSRCATMESVEPESLNGTNGMRLMVFGSQEHGQARLVALLDNLGKGASGAAVQNLNLMLGFAEGAGLDGAAPR